jgi:predicted nucleic acid-binding Zn ribbon protein
MERNRSSHVRNIVEGLISKWDKETGKKGGAAREAWTYAVDEEIRKHTKPASLKKGTMLVIVEDTSWLYRLTLEKRNILARFNEKYTGRNKPSEIRFRIGSLDDR